MGRPSKYTPELIDMICTRLSSGEPLAQICREEGMPGITTIWDWEKRHPFVSERIAQARDDGHDSIAANVRLTARGIKDYSTNDVQRDKLIVETDLKLLAKWNPRKYGEKQEITTKTSELDGLTPSQLIELSRIFKQLTESDKGGGTKVEGIQAGDVQAVH